MAGDGYVLVAHLIDMLHRVVAVGECDEGRPVCIVVGPRERCRRIIGRNYILGKVMASGILVTVASVTVIVADVESEGFVDVLHSESAVYAGGVVGLDGVLRHGVF